MSDPTTEVCWSRYLQEAYLSLMRKQSAIMQQYHLENHERFSLDPESDSLVFLNNDRPAVIARIQIVGSVSTRSDTWLWSWANSKILSNSKNQMHRVRIYGETHHFAALTTEQWFADEIDGWEMTSVSARILKARGAYRITSDNGFIYLVITDLKWAN